MEPSTGAARARSSLMSISATTNLNDAAQLRARKRILEAELKRLQAALASYKRRPVRIGLLGIRGACKSSLP